MANPDDRARVAQLPSHSGDGYGYGGGAVLIIGEHAIQFGEGSDAYQLAKEVARRWNGDPAEPQKEPF